MAEPNHTYRQVLNSSVTTEDVQTTAASTPVTIANTQATIAQSRKILEDRISPSDDIELEELGMRLELLNQSMEALIAVGLPTDKAFEQLAQIQERLLHELKNH